jgi:competence protein ComEC
VLRAAIRVPAAAAAALAGRRSSPLPSLCLAAAAILVADPSALFTPSFVLSFSAVAGIFLGASRLRSLFARGGLGRFLDARGGGRILSASRRAARALVDGVSVTCAAFLATLPASCGFFGAVPLIAPLANVLAVPLFSFVFLPTVLVHAAVCLSSPRIAGFLGPAVDALACPLLAVVTVASRAPPVEIGGAPAVVASTGLVLSSWLASARRWTAAALVAGGAVSLLLLATPVSRALRDATLDGKLLVVFLDVGQGDAAYVRTPAGRHILVDAGPSHPGAGRRAPVPSFLRSRHVERVDLVLLSHPHSDHFGGLADLLDASIGMEEVVLGVPESDPGSDTGFLDLLGRLRSRGTRISPPPACGPLSIDGLEAIVVHPCTDGGALDVNDRSMVVLVRGAGLCVLFTGDIGEAVEDEVASRIPFPCQVLKVPHHGSRRSSSEALLSVPGLEWAVVSAREGNRHGLPHPEALRRIRASGLEVLRVDTEGAWSFLGAGGYLTVRDFEGREIGLENP